MGLLFAAMMLLVFCVGFKRISVTFIAAHQV